MPEWPMAETDKQINNLRAAFSADLDRPFDLRPSFPYGSPSSTTSPLRRPSEDIQSHYLPSTEQAYYQQQQQQHYSQQPQTYFPTPPVSNVNGDSKSPTPQFYTNYPLDEQHHAQFRHMAPTSFPQQAIRQAQAWNPSPIIDHFNTAFAIPPSALQPPNALYGSSPPISIQSNLPQQQFTPSPQTPTYDLNAFARHQAQAQAEAQVRIQAQTAQIHQNQAAQSIMSSRQAVQSPSQPQPQRRTSYYNQSTNSNTSQQVSVPQNYTSGSQSNLHDQSSTPSQPQLPGMVYVSAKEWQQSVASVVDSTGQKRRWGIDLQPV